MKLRYWKLMPLNGLLLLIGGSCSIDRAYIYIATRYFAWSRSRKIQVNPRNSQKHAKYHEIRYKSVFSNTCLYSNFETCLSYWGYLLAVNSQIYVKTLSLKCANNVRKLPGIDYVVKNWALAMMLKGCAIGSFLEHNDDLCYKNIKNAGLFSANPIDF